MNPSFPKHCWPGTLLLLPLLCGLVACNTPPSSNQPSMPTSEVSRREAHREERYRQDRNASYSQRAQQDGDPAADSDSDDHNNSYSRSHRRHRHDRERARSAADNTPGHFDFYLLNLSWAPEYCHAHPEATECSNHSAFVLHGLWPQNNDGSYPAHCTDAPGPVASGRYAGLYPDAGLMQHEWQMHGTCSGLSSADYLAAAQRARQSVTIPPALAHLSAPAAMPPQQILGLFQASNPGLPTASLALSCGNNYLTAVEVCLDRSLHPIACEQVRSCNANTVRIPAP